MSDQEYFNGISNHSVSIIWKTRVLTDPNHKTNVWHSMMQKPIRSNKWWKIFLVVWFYFCFIIWTGCNQLWALFLYQHYYYFFVVVKTIKKNIINSRGKIESKWFLYSYSYMRRKNSVIFVDKERWLRKM